MKGILGLIVLLAIGIGAWALFQVGSDTEATATGSETTESDASGDASGTEEEEEEVTEPEPDLAETVEEEVQDGLDDLKEEAETATDALKEEVEDAVEAAEDKVDETLETVKEEADQLLDQGSNKVQEALEDALGGADQTGAEQGADGTAEADPAANLEHDAQAGLDATRLEDALSVESFDGLAIREALEQSDLGDLAKTSIESLITVGEQNPDQRQDVIDQIRKLMGL